MLSTRPVDQANAAVISVGGTDEVLELRIRWIRHHAEESRAGGLLLKLSAEGYLLSRSLRARWSCVACSSMSLPVAQRLLSKMFLAA